MTNEVRDVEISDEMAVAAYEALASYFLRILNGTPSEHKDIARAIVNAALQTQ